MSNAGHALAPEGRYGGAAVGSSGETGPRILHCVCDCGVIGVRRMAEHVVGFEQERYVYCVYGTLTRASAGAEAARKVIHVGWCVAGRAAGKLFSNAIESPVAPENAPGICNGRKISRRVYRVNLIISRESRKWLLSRVPGTRRHPPAGSGPENPPPPSLSVEPMMTGIGPAVSFIRDVVWIARNDDAVNDHAERAL